MSILNRNVLHDDKKFAYKIAVLAVRSLYKEVSLSHKPGLVSFIDSGSHKDMDANTFMKSIFSLRNYFKKITLAGSLNMEFKYLQYLGLDAEKKMFKATNGINTHKGAIFSLGILCAATGLLHKQKKCNSSKNISNIVRENWGAIILNGNNSNEDLITNGQIIEKKYGFKGARFEAANGFLSITQLALPALINSFKIIKNEEESLIQTLFVLMENLSDTNVIHRGNKDGLAFVQNSAREFLQKGGVLQKDWKEKVLQLHNTFILKNLSPGGSADLLASSYFIYTLEKENL